jgi:hypothetical protein
VIDVWNKQIWSITDIQSVLLEVANDDVDHFNNNNTWLKHHPIKSKTFSDLDLIWPKLKSAYTVNFKEMA